MRDRIVTVCLLVCALVVPSIARAQLTTQPYVTGLHLPVAFISDPTAPDRHFIVEQMGRIRVVVNGVLLAEDFLNVVPLVTPRTPIEAERGLIGLVLAPDYATSGRFYIAFTRESSSPDERGDLVIARYKRSSGNPLVADPASRFDLRWGSPTGPTNIDHSSRTSHYGASMVFGPDGYLYIGVGDGGGAGDPDQNAQNPMELKGKILRIDVNVPDDDPQGYRIPPDNPFVDNDPVTALPEIWAFGVRNPWRMTFDDPALGGTGALLIADVGQDRWEEVTYEPAGMGGRNYGWPIVEGTNPYINPDVPGYIAPSPAFLPLTEPAYEYYHSAGTSLVEGLSVIGGYVYRGAGLGEAMRGRYFFADFAHARIWTAKVTPTGNTASFSAIVEHTETMDPRRLSSFAVDSSGELYLVRYGAADKAAVLRVCGFTVTPILTSFSAEGGIGTIAVTAPAGCAWSVSELSPGMALVSNVEMRGSAVVQFRVAANEDGADREMTVNVAGQVIRIAQRSTPPIPGDINGDAGVDLLWQHDDGRLAAWFMHGTTLLRGVALGPGALSDRNWRIVATGDVDRDGNRDVVFRHDNDGRVAVWLMSGTALLSGRDLLQVAETAWKIRGAGDFDGDGSPDLLWQHEGDGRLAVWFMQGTMLREGRLLAMPIVPDQTWRVVAVADMNGDKTPDLVWQNQANGVLAAWLLDGLQYLDGILLSPSRVDDTNWKIRAAGDFNADGHNDLIWQHQASGMIAAWLMNGSQMVDSVLLTPDTVADTAWRIVGPK